MKGFVADIEDRVEDNRDFRRVIYTGPHMQLVFMSLAPGEEIGEEVHPTTDQFFRIEEGTGEVWIGERLTRITENSGILVPAGTPHNIVNTGHKPLKLYTIYAPPHHADGVVHHTKADAEADVEHFAGRTTE